MILLAVETSCDETAAALLEVAEGKEGDFTPEARRARRGRGSGGSGRTGDRGTSGETGKPPGLGPLARRTESDREPRTENRELPPARVLSDVVASQIAEHAPYGGVVPELASRRHLAAILPVIRGALEAAGKTLDDVDALAVTAGPGLVGSLLVGIQAAKAIAHVKGLPLIGVNHLAAHLLSSHLQRPPVPRPPDPGPLCAPCASVMKSPSSPSVPSFPHVSLVVSGGHTALYVVRGPERVERLASTRDDAAGEAFDKVGKLLGLPYPGGPAIDAAAQGVDPGDLRLPRGLDRRDTLDFSFSGLKTAVADLLRVRRTPPDEEEIRRIAAAFQESVVASLVKKSLLACERAGIRRLTLGGGVAANGALRQGMAAACAAAGIELFLPERSDCTDNAAMVGLAALPRLLRGEDDGGTLAARSSWPLGEA